MRQRSPTFKDLPLDIVGSTAFGRYPKISVEQTFNFIISDDFLVTYAGYENVLSQNAENPVPNPINTSGVGRGAYHSTLQNKIYVAVYNAVYQLTITNLVNMPPLVTVTKIGMLGTFFGDVFFAEDVQGHIAVCDKNQIYIYTVATSTFAPATKDGTNPIDFVPGYIAFHNTRFISVDTSTSQWRLSNPVVGNSQFPSTPQFVGQFQTKADRPVAVLPMPGKGNLILVMGSIVGELWVDVGTALFPYQRSTGVNIDFGCFPDSIANMDNITCWVGGNDRAGPAILVSMGGLPEQISNDGINFKLSQLTAPQDVHGFMFKQDGHIIYQVVWPTDNVSYAYDFMTKKFFTVTDENMNYHPAKKVVYSSNTYYFVSLNDANFYEFDTSITNLNYGYNATGQLIIKSMPRVRVCKTFRMPDTSPFVVNNLSFPVEMGVTQYPNDPLPRCDLAVSFDGGYQFSNFDEMFFNAQGNYRNRFIYYNLGWGNEFTPQFRFFSHDRFVIGSGAMSLYQ